MKKNNTNNKKRNAGNPSRRGNGKTGQRANNRKVQSSYRTQVRPGNQVSLPMSTIVDLPWTDDVLQRTATGFTFASWTYRANSPFDPDPVLGGQSAYLFATYASMYERYVVLSTKIDMTVVNRESFPVYVVAAPSTIPLNGTVVSNITAANLGELPYCIRPICLSAAGGQDRSRASKLIHWPTFIGQKQRYPNDDLFSSNVTNNPASVMWWNIALYSTGGLENGVDLSVRLTMRVLFTEINYSAALYRFNPRVKEEESKGEVSKSELPHSEVDQKTQVCKTCVCKIRT